METGIPSLDRLLGGGFHSSAINLVYGEPTAGKTTLTLTTVLNHLSSNRASKAVYLDIDNKLNVERLQQLFSNQDSLLKRFRFSAPDSFDLQSITLEYLPDLEPEDIVIIDSITGLYRGETEDVERTFQSNKELNRQVGYILEVAKTSGATMIITGQVRSILDSSNIEPVAPRILRYWSSTILKLEKRIQGSRQITLEKPAGIRSPIIITINDSGFVEGSS